ncbi:hypothetical protein CROQUDRAFT_94290 [Cronartium quercuum f. sp. fusiforme G11]|uniref:Uncharacterized protein n=1 Tax=Cronartium quercuum f. sp. fusiforme G11 TaxID=708437 RepID=A0A9P6NK67_9BASI|nr:hypothetical protein CROQUDRAFT_94290 [Cronartium quercuum f. sp. fusiforme G11]
MDHPSPPNDPPYASISYAYTAALILPLLTFGNVDGNQETLSAQRIYEHYKSESLKWEMKLSKNWAAKGRSDS